MKSVRHFRNLLAGIVAIASGVGIGWADSESEKADAFTTGLARRLDTVLAENLHTANRELPEDRKFKLEPPIADAGYCRRAYLIILGRNPTIEEVREFLGPDLEPSPGVEKREPDRFRLVRKLTESSEFARQEFRRWLARLELDPEPGNPAQAWLLSQFEARAPLDQWTVEWFGKYTVPFLAPDAPVSGAVDLVKSANWLEAFTGHGGMECAACHDHPFLNLTQGEFVRLAGFLNDQGVIRIPEQFVYRSDPPGSPVPASTFFGKTELRTYPETGRFAEKIGSEPWPNIGSARMLGEWLVKPDSLFFDRNIVIRGWRRVFGVEISDRFETDRGGKLLIEKLIEILHAVGHEQGRFLQVLMASRITQLKSVPFEKSSKTWNDWILTGPVTRELTIDQRLRTLTILETDQTEPPLDVPMNPNGFRPEAAWLSSADLERRVTGNPLAAIWSGIEKAESDADALEQVYLATLARPPGEEELAAMLESLGVETEARWDRMARALWALLLAEEFAWIP